MSKIMTGHVGEVTYLHRNITIVCGASYHLLGSQISQDSKIRFQLQVKSYISNRQFSESRHLASYVSRHNAMAYDTEPPNLSQVCEYNCVRLLPYAHGQHINVLKHFVFV
jgi:hypothetical protein